MLPAHQGLDADHLLATQADQRLVVDAQFLMIQGMAQGAGHFDPLAGVLGQLLAVEGIAFSAAVFCLEQRGVRVAQYLANITGLSGVQADADTGGDKQLLLVDFEGLGQACL